MLVLSKWFFPPIKTIQNISNIEGNVQELNLQLLDDYQTYVLLACECVWFFFVCKVLYFALQLCVIMVLNGDFALVEKYL